jgi:hypothetical protein
MAILIELIAQHGNGNHQGADDEIEHIAARHGRSLRWSDRDNDSRRWLGSEACRSNIMLIDDH